MLADLGLADLNLGVPPTVNVCRMSHRIWRETKQ